MNGYPDHLEYAIKNALCSEDQCVIAPCRGVQWANARIAFTASVGLTQVFASTAIRPISGVDVA